MPSPLPPGNFSFVPRTRPPSSAAQPAPPSRSATSARADRYAARGVSAKKTDVHRVVDRLDRGLLPGAFCKVLPDLLSGDPAQAVVIHADGAGTKAVIAYLHYRETGDPSVFRGIAQDSIVMNLDDLLCVGVTEGIVLSSTVNRNARRVPGEVLAALIAGTEAFLATLRGLGVGIHSGGGETADVGDLTGTLMVDSCAVARLPRQRLVDDARIGPGLDIVGLASSGRVPWEDAENSGIGSNGLTSARHDLLGSRYRERYPETFDSATDPALVYAGPFLLADPLPGSSTLTVGQALLSPTRTYAPFVRALLSDLGPRRVRGLVHCSGGGQTKCLRFGSGVHFVKDNLFPPPPLFTAIQEASGTSLQEMYQVFNMGHRLEVFVAPRDTARLLRLAAQLGLEARLIGRTEPSTRPDGRNHLTLKAGRRTLRYSL